MAAVIARLQASIAAQTAEAASEVAAEAEGVAETAVAELEAIMEEEVGIRVPACCVASCCWWQTLFAIKAGMGQLMSAFTRQALAITGKSPCSSCVVLCTCIQAKCQQGHCLRCCLRQDVPSAGHRGSCEHPVRALQQSKYKTTFVLATDAGGPCWRW